MSRILSYKGARGGGGWRRGRGVHAPHSLIVRVGVRESGKGQEMSWALQSLGWVLELGFRHVMRYLNPRVGDGGGSGGLFIPRGTD